MSQLRYTRIIHAALVFVALFFGVLTMFAGSRILMGADPGYLVFHPLLAYNTSMGLIYVVAGVLAWRNLEKGKRVAGVIFVLNLIVLGVIYYLHNMEKIVAIESVHAMTLRTGVWFVLYIGLVWLERNQTQGMRVRS